MPWELWPAAVLIACTGAAGWAAGWVIGNWLALRDLRRVPAPHRPETTH